MKPQRDKFFGQIAGLGTQAGTRIVMGRWRASPFGAFCDAMVERADGHRILLAPTAEVRDFVSATYHFDETRLEAISLVTDSSHWEWRSASMQVRLQLGPRAPLGRLLRVVPARVASAPAWARLINPVAGVVAPGVRTAGVAQAGRQEFYGALDMHQIGSASAQFDGLDLGQLAKVDPPCRFGFSSTPKHPAVTDVVTTIVTRAPTNAI